MIFLSCIGTVLLFLLWENLRHQQRLKRIPLRIHVNGIRGKTSTAIEIAKTLNKAGIRTVAKTTGDEAVMILPDAKKKIIKRQGPARIQEQLRVVKEAVACRAEALVVECMALNPLLQMASERRILKSHIGIITNVRQDHQEVMGKNLDDIADCLRCTMPDKGTLVTTDPAFFPFFASAAEHRGSRAILARAKEVGPLPERKAVVQSVCALLNIEAKPDLEEKSTPELFRFQYEGHHISFVDAFSVNDVDSFNLVFQQICKNNPLPKPVVALLNNRADRPLRMKSFASYLAGSFAFAAVVIVGEHRFLAEWYLGHSGPAKKFYSIRSKSPGKVFDEICRRIQAPEMTLLGMGNHKGMGEILLQYVRENGIK